jgi:hypothetical protein
VSPGIVNEMRQIGTNARNPPRTRWGGDASSDIVTGRRRAHEQCRAFRLGFRVPGAVTFHLLEH